MNNVTIMGRDSVVITATC